MINEIREYIEQVVDNEVSISANSVYREKLPLYIAESFTIYDLVLLGINAIMLYENEGHQNTPDQLSKIKTIVERELNTIVLFAFDYLESYNKQRLINKRVNFVIADKQIFIPSMLLDLNSRKSVSYEAIDLLPPLAQVIVLYHIQVSHLNGYTTRDISELLNSSYITINRAVKSLESLGIVTLDEGKEKKVNFSYSGKELWDEASKYLQSPVKRIVYADDTLDISNIKQSYINALSVYTMIAGDREVQVAMTLSQLKALRINTDTRFGENRIEIWKYDPSLLSDSDCVDKLSLYLSLKDNTDDRVQIELEELINSIEW